MESHIQQDRNLPETEKNTFSEGAVQMYLIHTDKRLYSGAGFLKRKNKHKIVAALEQEIGTGRDQQGKSS